MIVFRWLATAIETLSDGMAWVGQAAIFLMFPTITADVFMRYVFDSPIPGVFEIVQLLNVLAMALLVAYVQRRKQHVYIDLFITRFPPRLQFLIEVVIYLAGLGFFGMLTWQLGLWSAASVAIMEKTMGLINFPIYVVKLLLTFGCGVMSLMLLVDIVRSFRRLLRPPVGYVREKAEF